MIIKISKNKNGFTLVELAIVIVIIGLLVGGVLQGQALIEQSKVRNTIKDMESYFSAFTVFYDKYKAIPGDMPNASTYFSDCASYVGSTSCDGDGNRLYDDGWAGGDSQRFWAHLYLAKLVQPLWVGNKSRHYFVSKSYNIGVFFASITSSTFAPTNTGGVPSLPTRSNFLIFSGHLGGSNDEPVISANSAKTIDLKIDDGLPQTGKAFGGKASKTTNLYDCLTSGNEYLVSQDERACLMAFILPN